MPIPGDLETLVAFLAAACLLLTGVVAVLALRVARLARLAGGSAAGDAAGEVQRVRRDVSTVEQRLRHVEEEMNGVREGVNSSVRHVGVVRYDAFRDMGGHMSFSLALLDDRRNGVVLSILNGRDGSRGYAKAIEAGHSASPLSEEEQEALSQALEPARAR